MTSPAASISHATRAGTTRQHEIDAHVLAAAQQPRRGQQRHDIERVFGDFVGPGESGARHVAQQNVGGDQHDHDEQDQRRQHGERVEQPAEGVADSLFTASRWF